MTEKKITSFRGKYDFLSNFSHVKVYMKVECIQPLNMRFKRLNVYVMLTKEKIRIESTPAAGRKIRIKSNWNSQRKMIMERLLRLKFNDAI